MINNIYVPNCGPSDAKILLVGESPGETEERQREPFVGESGSLLMEVLNRAGISRNEVYLANLSHYRPYKNEFKHLIDTPQLAEGIKDVEELIRSHNFNVIVPLGSQPLRALHGGNSIHAWRGSITQEKFRGTKAISTFHPSAVLRDRTLLPIFDSDIFRIAADSKFPELKLPERKFIIDPRGLELEECVRLLEASEEFSVDIESTRKGDVGTKYILCVGFSPSPDLGICIANHGSDTYRDSEFDNALSRILCSSARKVFHFGTFDVTALGLNGYHTNNYAWDTLTAQHVLNAEMPRGLDFLTSLYTREPYYKTSGRSEIPGDSKEWSGKVDRQALYVYNCRDACTTIEIKKCQELEMTLEDKRLFDYEMSLIPVALEIGRNGLLVDMERREQFKKGIYVRKAKLQTMMDTLCGRPINVRSPKLKDLLFDDFGLPVQRKRDGKVTTDEDAIVALIGIVMTHLGGLKSDSGKLPWQKKLVVLKTILEIRGLRQLESTYLNAKVSYDNRIRSIYKYSNTETGRGACEKYIDGSGVNAQTFPRGSVEVPENFQDIIMLDLDSDDETEEVDDE